jgi:hypothetical protein
MHSSFNSSLISDFIIINIVILQPPSYSFLLVVGFVFCPAPADEFSRCFSCQMFVHIVRNIAFLWLGNACDIWLPERNFAGHWDGSWQLMKWGLSQANRYEWNPWLYRNLRFLIMYQLPINNNCVEGILKQNISIVSENYLLPLL